jgi:hypothetical protein
MDTVNFARGAAPQQALTFLAIKAMVDDITKKLENLGITLGGTASAIVGTTSQELNNRLEQLRQLVQDQVAVPIASLGLDVQELARQITSSVERLDQILTAQQQCLYQNASLLLSSLSNITMELKRPIPFDKTLPQVTHFQFDGSLPSAVPTQGGRMTVFGVGLWRVTNLPPLLRLLSADRTQVLATPTAQPAGSTSNFSTVVDPTVISANAGQCLQLHVQAREKKGFIIKKVVTTDLYLPVCISQSIRTEFSVTAEISYDKETTAFEDLSAQEFREDNSSCENRRLISGLQKAWPLPHGGRIVSWTSSQGPFHRHQSSISYAINGDNTMVANGWLDTASCTCVPIAGCKLNSTTIYQYYITPRVQYKAVTSVVANGQTNARVPMSLPNTQMRVLIPKDIVTPSTVFRFTLRKFVNGAEVGTPYDSSRITVNTTGGTTPVSSWGGLLVTGRFNPAPVSGQAELVLTIQAPSCGS